MIEITFPRNNRRLNDVFNTIDESNFNHNLLREILELSYGKKIVNYILNFTTEYKKDGSLKNSMDNILKSKLITK